MESVNLKGTQMHCFRREESHYYQSFDLLSYSVCRKKKKKKSTYISKVPMAWLCEQESSKAEVLLSATPTPGPDTLQFRYHSYCGVRAHNFFMQGTSELKASKEPFHA